MTKVGIIDCGVSNLSSVRNAFESQDIPVEVIRDRALLDGCSHLVLPGVGAFKAGMATLREKGFEEALKTQVEAGKPLLGICLGMQFLADNSDEFGLTEGLGLIPAPVTRIDVSESNLRLPHVGWNSVRQTGAPELWAGIEDEAAFYFVHSFAFSPETPDGLKAGICEYGGEVVAAVARDNVSGVQFHPEKSQKSGLTLLGNFAKKC